MRHVCVLLLIGIVACSRGGDDGDVTSMEVPEKALAAGEVEVAAVPPGATSEGYSSTEVIECMGGGQVQIQISWSKSEDPYLKRYSASWSYDECDTFTHGVIDGNVRYSKNKEWKEEGADDDSSYAHWFTGVHYHADLVYTASDEYECDAYMQLYRKTENMIDDLALKDHCKHPASVWWGSMGF